jgi:universal stress protein family protein
MNERDLRAPVVALLEGVEEEDHRVLSEARRLAGEAPVALLRVRPLPRRSRPGETLSAPRIQPYEQMRALEAEDHHYAARVSRRLGAAATRVQVRFGETVRETAAAAAELGAGLVIAASRPGGIFRQGRDGRLAREVHVPVLLVAQGPEPSRVSPRLAHQQ